MPYGEIEMNNTISLFESNVKYDLANANKIANSKSSKLRQYFTAVRCEPDTICPKYCWIVTNKFDPRVVL